MHILSPGRHLAFHLVQIGFHNPDHPWSRLLRSCLSTSLCRLASLLLSRILHKLFHIAFRLPLLCAHLFGLYLWSALYLFNLYPLPRAPLWAVSSALNSRLLRVASTCVSCWTRVPPLYSLYPRGRTPFGLYLSPGFSAPPRRVQRAGLVHRLSRVVVLPQP